MLECFLKWSRSSIDRDMQSIQRKRHATKNTTAGCRIVQSMYGHEFPSFSPHTKTIIVWKHSTAYPNNIKSTINCLLSKQSNQQSAMSPQINNLLCSPWFMAGIGYRVLGSPSNQQSAVLWLGSPSNQQFLQSAMSPQINNLQCYGGYRVLGSYSKPIKAQRNGFLVEHKQRALTKFSLNTRSHWTQDLISSQKFLNSSESKIQSSKQSVPRNPKSSKSRAYLAVPSATNKSVAEPCQTVIFNKQIHIHKILYHFTQKWNARNLHDAYLSQSTGTRA